MKALIDATEDFYYATDLFGEDFVYGMSVEEVGEYLQSLNHLKRGRCTSRKVVEEGCDSIITIYNVLLISHPPEEIEKILQEKLEKMRSKVYESTD